MPPGRRHDDPLAEARQFWQVRLGDGGQSVTVGDGVGGVVVHHDQAAQQLRSRHGIDIDEECVGAR